MFSSVLSLERVQYVEYFRSPGLGPRTLETEKSVVITIITLSMMVPLGRMCRRPSSLRLKVLLEGLVLIRYCDLVEWTIRVSNVLGGEDVPNPLLLNKILIDVRTGLLSQWTLRN